MALRADVADVDCCGALGGCNSGEGWLGKIDGWTTERPRLGSERAGQTKQKSLGWLFGGGLMSFSLSCFLFLFFVFPFSEAHETEHAWKRQQMKTKKKRRSNGWRGKNGYMF